MMRNASQVRLKAMPMVMMLWAGGLGLLSEITVENDGQNHGPSPWVSTDSVSKPMGAPTAAGAHRRDHIQDGLSQVTIGSIIETLAESPHPYDTPEPPAVIWSQRFVHPGATYVKVHVARLALRPGDVLELLDSRGRVEALTADDGLQADFWSLSALGEWLLVRLVAGASPASPGAWGILIDRYAAGFVPDSVGEASADANAPYPSKSICGDDDLTHIECIEEGEPERYERGRAVGKVIIGGATACSGFLVSAEGHFMTNNHCVSSQQDVEDTEVIFNYKRPSCTSTGTSTTYSYRGKTFITTDSDLDMTLFTLDEEAVHRFGYVRLSSQAAQENQAIYIVQHPGGGKKKYADNTVNSSGTTRVGYFADTEGGSSGSPVFSQHDGRVVALHNTGGCPNGGHQADAILDLLGGDLPDPIFELVKQRPFVAPEVPVVYAMEVVNRKNTSHVFELKLEDGGFATQFAQTGTDTLTTDSLEPGAAAEVLIEITAGALAQDGDVSRFRVHAEALNDASYFDVARIAPEIRIVRDVRVDENAELSADPGTRVIQPMAVVNTGNVPDTFKLSLEDGSPFQFGDGTQAELDARDLLPGERFEFELVHDMPPQQRAGVVDEARVLALQQDGECSASASVQIVTNTVYDVVAEALGSRDQATAPDQAVTWEVVVRNLSNTEESFVLRTASTDRGFQPRLAQSQVTLAAQGDANDSATVTVTVEATAGDLEASHDRACADIAFEAESSSDSSKTAELSLRARMEGISAVAVETLDPKHPLLVAPGTAGYRLQVTNHGKLPETFALTAISDRWQARLGAATTQLLSPGQSTVVALEVTVPKGSEGGFGYTQVDVAPQCDPSAKGKVGLTTQYQLNATIVGVTSCAAGGPPSWVAALALVLLMLPWARRR